mgnify:CR=1 FL=1
MMVIDPVDRPTAEQVNERNSVNPRYILHIMEQAYFKTLIQLQALHKLRELKPDILRHPIPQGRRCKR